MSSFINRRRKKRRSRSPRRRSRRRSRSPRRRSRRRSRSPRRRSRRRSRSPRRRSRRRSRSPRRRSRRRSRSPRRRRCWQGYEPTPGIPAYSRGSCRRMRSKRRQLRGGVDTVDDLSQAFQRMKLENNVGRNIILNAIRQTQRIVEQEYTIGGKKVKDKLLLSPDEGEQLPGIRVDRKVAFYPRTCSGDVQCTVFAAQLASTLNLKFVPFYYESDQRPIGVSSTGRPIFGVGSQTPLDFPIIGAQCYKLRDTNSASITNNYSHDFCVYFEGNNVFIVQSFIRRRVPLIKRMDRDIFIQLFNEIIESTPEWPEAYFQLFGVPVYRENTGGRQIRLDLITVQA